MTAVRRLAAVGNSEPVRLTDVPELPLAALQEAVIEEVSDGARVSALFAVPRADSSDHDLYVVLAEDLENCLRVARACVTGDRFTSLTPACPQVHLFEREILELRGLRPEGHPWLKPVRFPRAGSANRGDRRTPESAPIGLMDFYRVDGDEVHEVAVGPVHAGVIEPGHFRFQCHGEVVHHLEISLGYQHRGIEPALVGGPGPRTIHHMEQAAGDTTAGHATAFCQSVEALSAARVSARAQAVRGIALELERMANHTGDLGALAGDVGFLPTASYCGRLRGDFLNMSALICGNRFGRGLIRPGGVDFDIEPTRAAQLLERLAATLADVTGAVELLWDSPSVMARFEETGRVSLETCNELGLVGPAARACGAARDVRQDLPAGIYRFGHLPIATALSGDVFARAYVRWLEIQRSATFVQDQLKALPAGELRSPVGPLRPGMLVASLLEGWRGEICHVALTDERGRFCHYKMVDPSFHNWIGLAMALRGQQISDFPLCNKSFNLSYCGFDL